MVRPRRLIALVFGAVVALSLFGGCDIEKPDDECDRLRDFGCICFPNCLDEDVTIIDSQDEAACDAQLRKHARYWERCEGRCGVNCEFGWNQCAFGYYRALGFAPSGACTLDGGVPADSGLSEDAGSD
jgi:hypothetical protein